MNLIKKHLKKQANNKKEKVKEKLLSMPENEAYNCLCNYCNIALFKSKEEYMDCANDNITDWFYDALDESEQDDFDNDVNEYKKFIKNKLHGKYFAYNAFECPAYADEMVPALPLMYDTLEDLIDDLLKYDGEFGFFYKDLLDKEL